MADDDRVERAPGTVRAYDTAANLASAAHAVIQPEDLQVELEDGWEFRLTKYKYSPLAPDEIRLLRVLPLEDSFETKQAPMLRCELIHVALDAAPDYIALSHVWGDLQDFRPVVVGEGEFVMITASLYLALAHGVAGLPVHCWVDQICINQLDLAEKKRQKSLIADIYGEASVTMIRLAEEEEETTDAASDMISRIAKCSLSPLKAFELLEDRDLERLKAILEADNISSDASDPGWEAMKKISSNPWFMRLWTFQEVVVSRDLLFMCGKHPCMFPNLIKACTVADLVCCHRSVAVAHLNLILLHRDRWREGRGFPLLDLLRDVGDERYTCTEPRDYVYALLPLQESLNSHAIDVDYTKPLAVVLRETARAIIDQTESLSILHRRRFGYLEDLPSWAPDWTRQNVDKRLNDKRLSFSCADGLKHLHEKSEPEFLIAKGKVVAKITKTAAHRFSDHEQAYVDADVAIFLGQDTLVPQLMSALQECQGDGHEDGRRGTVQQKRLLAMTLTAGLFEDEDESVFESDGDEAAAQFVSVMHERALVGQGYVQKCLGRKVAMLDSVAYPIGLVPDYARRDDLVCVVNGSETPLVLRRVDQHFEYIGECYVHGIMYGEAVDWDQRGGDRFEIR